MNTIKFFSSLSLLLLLALITGGCTENRRDIRDYYFPLRKLTDGQVYEYQVVGNEKIAADIWYYRSLVSDSSIHLIATAYDGNLLPAQLSRQQLVSNGIKCIDLKLYTPDTTGISVLTSQAEILSGAVFPFHVKQDEGLYLYQVQYELPEDPGPTTLIINRQYAGKASYNWQGKSVPAIRFRLNAQAEIEDNVEGSIDPSFQGEEIYAKGIGLVYYSRFLGPDTLAYQLVEQYDMVELERRFGAKLNEGF